jgi:hypothetical protein
MAGPLIRDLSVSAAVVEVVVLVELEIIVDTEVEMETKVEAEVVNAAAVVVVVGAEVEVVSATAAGVWAPPGYRTEAVVKAGSQNHSGHPPSKHRHLPPPQSPHPPHAANST